MLTYYVKGPIVLLLEIVTHVAVDYLFTLFQSVEIKTFRIKALVPP